MIVEDSDWLTPFGEDDCVHPLSCDSISAVFSTKIRRPIRFVSLFQTIVSFYLRGRMFVGIRLRSRLNEAKRSEVSRKFAVESRFTVDDGIDSFESVDAFRVDTNQSGERNG